MSAGTAVWTSWHVNSLTDKPNHLYVQGRYARAAKRVKGTSILPAHTTQGLSAGPPAATLEQRGSRWKAASLSTREQRQVGAGPVDCETKQAKEAVTLVVLLTLVVLNAFLFFENRRMH